MKSFALFSFLFITQSRGATNAPDFESVGVLKKLEIDFSQSGNILFSKRTHESVLKLIADFTRRKTISQDPLKLDSIVYSLNPVLNNQTYELFFRFNLVDSQGRKFGCDALTVKDFSKYSAGCYPASK